MSNYSFILGSTRGLGRAITEECQKRGWKTIGMGSSIKSHRTAQHVSYHCDLTNLKDIQRLQKRLDNKNVKIERFFWVAGRLLKGPFSQQHSKKILDVIDINFRNSILIAQSVWQHMEKAHNGRTFTVIASTSGIRSRQDEAAYVATKFAQVGFTRSIATENKNPFIKVSLFLPGGMNTGMRRVFPKSANNNLLKPEKVAYHIVERITHQKTPFLEELIERGTL